MAEAHRLGRVQDHSRGNGLRLGTTRHRPVGVFDSGVGGLSVLNALRVALPHEDFVYYADAAHAPYGERDDAFVAQRTQAVARALRGTHDIKALVVACNTATAAAIHLLRADHPDLPLVGLEPAIKPAVALSQTRHIAVLATRGTVTSRKFQALRDALAGQAHFHAVACDGLAAAIEQADSAQIARLCERYVRQAGDFGGAEGQIDTLVLGCTHYPLVADAFRRHTGAAVRFIDTGAPVAQQTQRLLAAGNLLVDDTHTGDVTLTGSGDIAALEASAARWIAWQTAPTASTLAPSPFA